MALVKCAECGNDISPTAKFCPKCGAKPKKTSVFIYIIALIAFPFVLNSLFGTPSTPEAPAVVEHKSPDDIKSDARFEMVGKAGAMLKSSMRDPDSVEWVEILSNDDASVICFTYRGKNGFGGISIEQTVVSHGRASKSASIWNKKCSGQDLHNDTVASRNIDNLYQVLKTYH